MSRGASDPSKKLLRVGELARAAGKTVRAVHLYEELGLLSPATRTDGGFRLYYPDAVERIAWIVKLQAVGFTLSDIQGFIRDFEGAASGREATARVRDIFQKKRQEIRQQIAQLEVIDDDLEAAIAYLDSCTSCSPRFAPTECTVCDHQGHEPGAAPHLFAGLSMTSEPRPEADYDVPVGHLCRGDDGSNERH